MADIDFNGMMARLDSLGKDGAKIVGKGQRAGAKVVQQEMIANAPEKSGPTKRSIKVRAGKKKQGKVRTLVGAGKKWYQGPDFIVAFVEFGHKVGKRQYHNSKVQDAYETLSGKYRKFVEGKHFMETSFENKASEAIETMKETTAEALEAKVKELNK